MVKNPVIVLGIDPGYGRCGWGVIEVTGNCLRSLGYGVIETSARVAFAQRLETLYKNLKNVIAAHAPQESAIEQLFFSRNVKTAINVGQARGVAVLTCAQAGLPVLEYKPGEIKLAVTGYGLADKSQVQRMVNMILGMKHGPKLDDAADALAVAICHAHSRLHRALGCRS